MCVPIVSCELFCVQDVCANTQACVHRFAHVLLVYKSRQDTQWVWGGFQLLVGRVGRKEGLGCSQDHVDLSSPCALPARRCFKQTLLRRREGRAVPTTYGGHRVDNAKMMKDLAFRCGFFHRLRSTKNLLSQRLFANDTTDNRMAIC